MLWLATLCFISWTVNMATSDCFPPFENQPPGKGSRADLYAGQQGFSLDLLKTINKVMPKENLFFSPYSTYHAMLIAFFTAGGKTEKYLKKVLQLEEDKDKSHIYTAYKLDRLMTQLLSKSAPYEFTSANKMYVSQSITVKDCVADDFPEELEKFDFKKDPEGARKTINKWVENATHHMIKDLLPSGTIDASTDLVLVNAAYFKGLWENKFKPELTKQEVFYVSATKQILVDMMHLEGVFRHDSSEALGAHILEMPYQGKNISMYVLLPPFSNTEDSIEATLKRLTLQNFKKIVEGESLTSKTVQIAFPKFSLETTVELVPVFEEMGLGNLFESTANFTDLLSENISLGRAQHKAKIEVDEEGTTAAAATILFSFRTSRPAEPTLFICNHPFIYFLYNKIEDAVMFAGVFRRPY